MPQSALLSGDAKKAAEIWSKARANYAAAKHAELVQDAVKKASNKAGSTYSGQNIDNATRQAVRKILDSDKLKRGFTDEEVAQMEKIAKGTWVGDLPRFMGNLLGGGGGFPSVIAAGTGAAAAGPVGAATPLVGYAFKKLGNVITAGRVSALDQMIRSRSPLAEEMKSTMARFGQAAANVQGSPTQENLARLTVAANSLAAVLYQNGIMVQPHELIGSAVMQDDKATDGQKRP